jgi:hypothetical protein
MSKKKLLLSIEDLKALGIIKKKKKRRNRKRQTKYIQPNIYGIKTDSQHMSGFGGQINSSNDLQNELVRQQMKVIEDDKNMRQKQYELAEMDQNLRQNQHQLAIDESRFNRNTYYPRIQQLENKHNQLVNKSQQVISDIYNKINKDNVDVAQTAGSDFFNVEGNPTPENDNRNVNITDFSGGGKATSEVPVVVNPRLTKQESLQRARMVKALNAKIRKEEKEKKKDKTENIFFKAVDSAMQGTLETSNKILAQEEALKAKKRSDQEFITSLLR